MSYFEPKKRALLVFVICFVISAILFLFTNANLLSIINMLFIATISLIFYFISDKIDIRYADPLFWVVLIIAVSIIKRFDYSSLAFNISINSWEKNIYSVAIRNCKNECLIKGRRLYDSNNVEIYRWHDLNYIYSGTISSNGNDITYQLSFEDKCVKKELKKQYTVTKGQCKKDEQ